MPKLFLDKLIAQIVVPLYKRRIAALVAKLCEDNASILDVGCNDGSFAKLFMQKNPSLNIKGVDIQDNYPCQIPRKVYDGKTIPYKDRQFDISLAVDVLHHTKDIEALIKEMKRVSKKYIIIKDVALKGLFPFLAFALTDWLTNAPFGIKCVYNYPSFKKWQDYFKAAGLKVEYASKTSSIPTIIFDKYNYIWKLKVRS